MGETHLFDTSQSLKPGVLDQIENQTVRHIDKAVYRIVEDLFLIQWSIRRWFNE